MPVPPVQSKRKRLAAVVLAASLVALFVGVAIAQGIGQPSVGSDEAAVVEDAPDGHISTDEFQAALKQAAARQAIKEVPPTSDPQYPALRDAAMSDILLSRWVRGEADERGITVSDSEISNQLEQIKKQQFGGEKQFQQFLEQAGFTLDDARERVELMLLSDQIQQEVLPENPSVSESQIKNFYEANKSQFEQPETRDIRQIVNQDQAKVEQAKSLLEQDDSPASWKTVAARFSTDKATKDSGGLRQGVANGQSEPALDDQIFSAAQGQLVGPFQGQAGYYLIEVEKINPAKTTPLSDASDQIKQQLSQGIQQEIAQAFQQDFIEKWTSRSFCAKGYVMERCENFAPSSVRVPGAPPVTSIRPVAPGSATLFPGQPAQGLPQGPIQPVAAGQPGVIGPPGAPLPPGAQPQPGAAPPGAPPGAAPPEGTAPPGG